MCVWILINRLTKERKMSGSAALGSHYYVNSVQFVSGLMSFGLRMSEANGKKECQCILDNLRKFFLTQKCSLQQL